MLLIERRIDGELTSGTAVECLNTMQMSLLSASVKPLLAIVALVALVALVGEGLVEADILSGFWCESRPMSGTYNGGCLWNGCRLRRF